MISEAGSILVIDDDTLVRTVIVQRLSAAGFRVVELDPNDSSIDTLKELKRVLDENCIKLAICDLLIPDQDGQESVLFGMKVIKELKRIQRTVPVVVLSGSIDKTSLEKLGKMQGVGLAGAVLKGGDAPYDELVGYAQKYLK